MSRENAYVGKKMIDYLVIEGKECDQIRGGWIIARDDFREKSLVEEQVGKRACK